MTFTFRRLLFFFRFPPLPASSFADSIVFFLPSPASRNRLADLDDVPVVHPADRGPPVSVAKLHIFF